MRRSQLVIVPGVYDFFSYLHRSRVHSNILMWLERSDPIFNMGFDVMRPALNIETKYKVTMLTREEWTREPGTPPVVKGLVWCTDRSSMMEGNCVGVYGQYLGRRLNISLGKRATVFQVEVYAIWASVYEIQTNARPEKYVSICSDNQVAVKALQAA